MTLKSRVDEDEDEDEEDSTNVEAYVINVLDERWKHSGPTYKTWIAFYKQHIDQDLCSLDDFQAIRYHIMFLILNKSVSKFLINVSNFRKQNRPNYTMRNVPASRRGSSGDDAASTVSSYADSDPPVDSVVIPAWLKEWQNRLAAVESRSNETERKMTSLQEEVKCIDRKIDGVNNSIRGLNADVSGQFADLKGLLLSSRSLPQHQDDKSSSSGHSSGFSAESHRSSSSDPRFIHPQSSSAAIPGANMIPPEHASHHFDRSNYSNGSPAILPQYLSPPHHQYYFNFGATPPTPR
jgi:hypothetical protein